MEKKTLLLNNNYETIGFITFYRVIKLIFNNKVEVISNWDDFLSWGNGNMKLPSIVRLKKYVNARPRTVRFSRYNVIKRDSYTCQYCGTLLTSNKITIDHITPRAKGGINSWENCVCCCKPCNNKKSNKTLEEAKMNLINKPFIPGRNLNMEYKMALPQHQDWKFYFIK